LSDVSLAECKAQIEEYEPVVQWEEFHKDLTKIEVTREPGHLYWERPGSDGTREWRDFRCGQP